MPIYEYRCESCDFQFEELVFSTQDPPPKSPQCGANQVEKLMSAAAVRPNGIPAGAGGFSGAACRPSTPG